jgi:hypothetical protein
MTAFRRNNQMLWIYGTLLSLWLLPLYANPDSPRVSIEATAPHEVSAEVCGSCHKEIYAEWKGSMHAQSTALNDPIHGAFYRKVVGDPREEGVSVKGKYPVCLRCHAPNAAMQKKTRLDATPAFNEGVNCVFCHTISAYKGTEKPDGKLQLGQAAYAVSTTTLHSPSGKNYSTAPKPENSTAITEDFHPFPMTGGKSALYKSSEVCMGCHDRRNNFHGVPLCATGTEIADSKSFAACQSCHMGTVNGHADHSMMGGHDGNMVRRAVIMNMQTTLQDGQHLTTISMINKLPHKFPTGAPFRNAYLKVTAYDSSGNVLWQNFKTHPIKEDPKAVLLYKLGDEAGNPAMPPKATQVLDDSRLVPNQERLIEYKIPAEKVAVIRAELLYHLLLPKLVTQLDKVLNDDLKAPRLAAYSEVRF